MTRDKIRSQAEERMKKSIQSLQDEFKTLRGSRASQSLFEKIRVDYYGNKVPLNQVATISIPEARLVIIQPWDRSVLSEIEKAIQKSELSVNPNNDGKVIRINIPPLTEERRKDLVKLTKNTAEQSRVSVRNVRRDANEEIKKAKSDSELSEDEAKKATDEIQKLTDKLHRGDQQAPRGQGKGNPRGVSASPDQRSRAASARTGMPSIAPATPATSASSWTATAAGPRRGESRAREGHLEGVKAAKRVVAAAAEAGLSYLSLYTFSTENWIARRGGGLLPHVPRALLSEEGVRLLPQERHPDRAQRRHGAAAARTSPRRSKRSPGTRRGSPVSR